MASSMLSGERRWASARKGGMTVLGKVAVPKPINLPSQRLENHGLDPNVEIVPKGTHIWGSRSSSSSNAWGSSSLSPNAEGGTGSPSYISGRPSSGGTGTRPSTAGSERANDAITIAWGSNSRPSSSSRVLTSNQTSQTALRPRSAETRPGSSHLSRFAEPLSDNLVAWGGSGTSEKLGVTSSKNDGFSLSTGDFPELGSEKENSGKTTDSQDHGSHGCPGSSCGVVSGKECIGNSTGDVSVNVNVKIGTAGAWRKENSLYGEDGARSNVEKWHVDPQLYPNNNMPPQHYDAWHGPPVNSHPSGVWYRGPPGGPPFGSPVAPGGFPMEPFPYYHPQMPPPPLANPQPVPPPGTGPRAPHPKNGDMYRPHMHDAYIRPGMPLRPGFYSGPVPYDGYYGPPMSYCNSNDRDVPFIGMAMGPAAYNRYTGQNVPDSGNCLVRTSGYGTSKMMVSEQVGAVHPQDARGPYKVLLKQHDSWEGKDEVQKWDETLNTDASYSLKGEHSRKSSWENGWRSDDKKDEEMDTRRMTLDGGASYEAVDNRAGPLKVKSPETVGSRNASDMSSVKKFDHAASKDSSLIQKIEGLNAKARACDVRQDVKSVSSGEEQKNNLQTGDATACHSTNEAGNASLSHEKSYGSGINSAPHEDRFSAGDKSLESTVISGTAIFRRSTHGRADHRGKGRFNKQEADGWRKKSHFVESPSTASTAHNELSSVSHGSDHNFAEAIQNSVSHASGKDDGESMPPVSDLNDSQAQHAKRRELAKRLKQREKEEEERTREQRAKALAKLEELNRRTQAGESVTQKLETVSSCAIHSRQESLTPSPPTMSASKSGAPNSSLGSSTNRVGHIREKLETVAGSVIQNRHEESSTAAPPTVVASKSRASGSAPGSSHSMIAQSSESSENRVEKSASVVSCISLGTPKTTYNESVIVHEQSKPFQQDGNYVDSPNRSSSWVQESSTSMQKRIGYKQKQNMEKNSNEKSIPSSVTEASKGHSDIATNTITSSECTAHEIASNCETNLSVKLSVAAEPSAHHRKNRSGKNRHKVEAASSAAVLPSKESKDAATLDTSVESVKSKASEKMSDHSSVQVPTNLNDANQSLELRSSLANEEGNIRVNNQWKSQHARRMMRNSQGNRSADKNHGSDNIIWAPVRSQNKIEVSDEANQNVSVEAVVSSTKSDQLVQNNPRNKRAEMERYVPKPVAKELSQHSSSHQAIVPSCNQVTSDEFIEMSESSSLGAESSQISTTAAGKVGSTMESRNGDFRPNKPGKVHGSWRQRGTTESTTNTGRNSQRSIEDHQHQETDETSMREKPRHSGEWNASDSWNMPENPDTPVIVPVLKGQDVSARGKRHPHKGQKGMGANHNSDEKRTVSVDSRKIYMQSTPEVHQLDSSVAAKENHIVGERSTSHWQPKSQALPTASQQGSRPNSSVNVVESGRVNKESFLNVHHGQSLSQKSIFEEASDVGLHQEPKRERKTAGQRGRSDSPVELTSHSTTDVQHDQRKSAGLCKNGSANSRYGREHESRGEWSGSGKDNKQHNLPAIRERQRQNSHYEYQPVGPQNNNKTNDFEPPKERPHNSRPRYRERGQSH